MHGLFRRGAIALSGLAVLGSMAGIAAAKGGVAPAKNPPGVVTKLTLVGGENPTIVGGIVSFASVEAQGGVLKLAIESMDAVRFPHQVKGTPSVPCVATMKLGTVSGGAPVVPDPQSGAATRTSFVTNAPVPAGSALSLDVVCRWTDRNGTVNAHETHWAGTL